ncbi:uncharacterized protein LOC142554748 [Primulina tabacum]|uniref:uncharacterized protein LOC142554748 n=1 Tax=Primulina tabacum TaxID=48773 RepID=UPI003F59A083
MASFNKIPMFSKEDYDDWKIRMQAHLAAQDDDMWYIITDGPMRILKVNTAAATTEGAPQMVMRALSRKWNVKTIAMRESKDLNKLELHDLFAVLKAYEFELGIRTEEDPSTSQQTKALAATIVTLPVKDSTSKKSAEQLSNEAISLFVKKFSKFMRKNQSQLNKPHFNKDHADDEEDQGKWAESESEKSISEESSSESEDEKVECLMAKEDQESTDEMATKKKELEESIWFMDSGCSRHMTGNKDLLSEIVNYKGPTITFGDNSKGKAVGKCKIIHGKVIIKHVLLIENLCYNLISIRQLCDKGYTVVFQKLICTVKTTAGNIMLTGHREQNTYKVKWNDNYLNAPTCFIALNGNKNWFWHKRLNHLNFKSIATISRLKLVSGLPNIDFAKDRICNTCQLGKQIRSTFKSRGRNSSARCLELLHMDLFGPIPVTSLGGKKYTLIVIDDFSRFTWVTFLNSKDQAADHLIKLLKRLQNEKSEAINRIKSDRGTEFLNQYLSSYLENHGIKHELSAARSPQQNGVAERRNRTLKEAARTMLAESRYSAVSKAYRVYNQRTLTVEESIHIVFDEYSICHDNSSNNIHDLINNLDATNLEASSDDEVDLRKTGGNISKENPTAQEQTQQIEPKKIDNALLDTNWIEAMQEELNQFERSKEQFEMSIMGELNYFLGLQVKQSENGIFINQAKYTRDMLKKFGMENCSQATTPMSSSIKLDKYEGRIFVDTKMYRGLIGSLLYLTASRLDIMFAVCLCARFQAKPMQSHFIASKRILKYLKGATNVGLWYPKYSGLNLVGYSDADYAGC